MRKIIVLSFMSLDGVMQAPGGPDEDRSGDFRYGGWVAALSDDTLGAEMVRQMSMDYDLLLGRRTYEIFASYWPYQDNSNPIAAGLNKARKYVVSESLRKAEWKDTTVISENVPEEIRKLKQSDGPDLQVHGSAGLIQTLLLYNLADELWLKIFPVLLGSGKKLFADERISRQLELIENKQTSSGVMIASYRFAGEVKTASF
jgi:dihydrofolate reductase